MQKRAKWARRGMAVLLIVILCLPLAMRALSADNLGVASERSGYETMGASASARAGNRIGTGFTEDSAGRMG
ncbi:MAG: hypothetical protein QOH04_1513 [Sphingomonadales bacterium]|nr:hypothetical protein [Sphingomonadales bacterium]